MNVLSLFDGMSCGQIAINRLKLPYNTYYASEVDTYAMKVTMANFPNTIQLGDVRNVDVSKLDRIGLLAGGSPCQSFSFAGKRKGMSTKCEIEILTLEHYLQLKSEKFEFEGQSYLFWEYMRILEDIRKYNPDVKFLLENVEMGKKWETILSRAIGINGVHINSALVSAQNRKRIYWTNIHTFQDGMFGYPKCMIPQPKDRLIFIKDIIEDEVDEKYYIKKPILGFNGMDISEKSKTIRTGGKGSQTDKHNCDIIKIDKKGNISPNQDKASCFTAGGNSGGNHSDMDILCVAMRGRNPEKPKSRLAGLRTKQMLEPIFYGKTNCITSVNKDNLVMQLNPSLESGGKQPYQHNRVYDTDGISPCINTGARSPIIVVHNMMPRSSKSGKGGTGPLSRNDGKTYCVSTSQPNALEVDYRLRRFTPTEVERLQTVEDGYTNHVSESQRYKMLGNGWTIEAICHIFSYLK
jgi:DNA-cytosine methyltransferase